MTSRLWLRSCRRPLCATTPSSGVAPPHDWWDWYAAYMDARQAGTRPEEASVVAGRYMAEVKHVVASPS